MRTIAQILEQYTVTRPMARTRKLNDEEIENGLCWVSDAVGESHLREALGYQASRHFARTVLPEMFWKGVEECQETTPV